MRRFLGLLGALALLWTPHTVAAQTTVRGVVVADCNTPYATLIAGQAAYVAIDRTTGKVCDIGGAGGGGGGGGAATVADGADITQGAKADAKSTATDATPVSIMQVLKEISAMLQAPPSRPVTNAGAFAVQAGGCAGGGNTAGGYQSAASTNATALTTKTWCGGKAINTTGTIYYLRFYDSASAPTCSSATGFLFTIPIPASASGAGTDLGYGSGGWTATNDVAWCLNGGGTSTDNTNAAVGVFLSYATR